MALTEDSRIVNLPKATEGVRQGVYPKYNPISNITEKITLMSDMGAVRASFDWQSDTTYNTDDLVLFNGLTTWKSLVDNNIGNVPSENTFWTQVTISEADGITDTQWAAGLFTYDDSKVVYENAQYYLQVPAPFESVDFVAELANGDWAAPVPGIVDEIVFSGTDPGYKNRQIFWDEESECPAYRNTSTNVTRQIGREFGPRAKNSTGSTITNGQLIQVVDDPGSEISIGLAKADALLTTDVLGWTTESIADGVEGEITLIGSVSDIDTKGYPESAFLYLSSDIAGDFTNIPPEVPYYVVPVGYVVTAQSAPGVQDGKIYARIGQIVPPNEGQKSFNYVSYKGIAGDENWIGGGFRSIPGFTPSATPEPVGEPLEMHSSHAYIVLGAASTNMIVRVTGTRWSTEAGGSITTGYTSDIDTSGGVLNQYFETPEHWQGEVEYTLLSGTGVICNGGLIKYWDNNNKRFVLTLLEWTGYCGADDDVDLELYEKKNDIFTYDSAGTIITPSLRLSDPSTLDTYTQIYEGENLNVKITGLSDVILGDGDQGIFFRAYATQEKGVYYSTVSIQLLERRYQ